MTASAMGPPRPVPDFGSLNLNVPPAPTAPIGRDREAQLTKRVRELEEDAKVLRAENESQVRDFGLRELQLIETSAETNDFAFPRKMERAERVCQEEEGGQGSCSGVGTTCARADR